MRSLHPLSSSRCLLLWLLPAFALIASACGSADAAGDAASTEPTVIATTSIWADIATNLACDGTVEVESVIPPGADPHGFEPSLADRQRMDDAAVIVANGLALEESLGDAVAATEATGTPVIRMGDRFDTLPVGGASNGQPDPHIWFDPRRVAAALPNLSAALVEHADLDQTTADDCLAAYTSALTDLDGELEALLAAVPADHRKLVTNHDAFGYFADRYGFEVIGTVIPGASSLAEPNPAQLDRLAADIAAAGVSAIFAEAEHGTDTIDALADRLDDIEVVVLEAGALGADADTATYIDLLRTNATAIATALS